MKRVLAVDMQKLDEMESYNIRMGVLKTLKEMYDAKFVITDMYVEANILHITVRKDGRFYKSADVKLDHSSTIEDIVEDIVNQFEPMFGKPYYQITRIDAALIKNVPPIVRKKLKELYGKFFEIRDVYVYDNKLHMEAEDSNGNLGQVNIPIDYSGDYWDFADDAVNQFKQIFGDLTRRV